MIVNKGRIGLHPKIETRKLGTLFIEWKGVEVVWQTPCLYQGVQGGRGAADRQRGERDRAARRVRYQTQRVVPLARCLSQGWRGWLAAAGGPAAGNREPAAAGCQPGGGCRTTRGGVGTQDRAAIAGSGFFAKSLQACKGVAPEEHRNWRDGIYGEIRSMMQLEGFQSSHACEIARVSRAGFYRHYEEHEPRQADVALRDLIQRIVLENRCYGYRRVAAELRHRGVGANRKRVLRLMRADNLLAVRKQRFVFTTDSRHGYAVYANLAARLKLTGVNQLWVADITYRVRFATRSLFQLQPSHSCPPDSVARMPATCLRRAGQSTLAAFHTSFQSIPKYAWIRMFRKATICGHGICGYRLLDR